MPTQKYRAYRDSNLELIALLHLWANKTAQQKSHDPFLCFLNIHDESNNFQTGFPPIMTATLSTSLFKSAKVKLSCHQYPQDFSIMPSVLCNLTPCANAVGLTAAPTSSGFSEQGHWVHAVPGTVLDVQHQPVSNHFKGFPTQKARRGKNKSHTSNFLLLFAIAALLGLPRTTSTCPCTYPAPLKPQHWQKVPHGKHLHEVPCSQGTPSSALVCPLTREALFEVQGWVLKVLG